MTLAMPRLFIAIAIALVTTASPGSSATPLTLAVIPAEVSGQAFYGMDEGFFSRAGLDVSTQIVGGGTISVTLLGGAAEVGLIDTVSLITAHAKNLPLTCIAPGAGSTTDAPAFGIVVKSDAPIHEAKDLNGTTIAVSGLNNIAALPTEAWIDRNGGDSKSIKWFELPYPQMVPALTRGTISIALLTEPWITQAKDANYRVVYPTKNGIAPVFLASCWAATTSWVQQNPALAKTFATQALAISRWANTHQTEAAGILAKYLKVPQAAMLRTQRYTFPETIDPNQLQPLIDAAAKYGIIPKAFSASEIMLR